MVSISFNVSGSQRSPVLLSSGETDGRPDGAVVPQPFQDATQAYCVLFSIETEGSHQNTE